nr:septum formation initiator family protein [Ruegeria sp. HKCCD8929]
MPAKGTDFEAVHTAVNRVSRSHRPSLGAVLFFAVAFALGVYFTFAAVQGDFGLFRRVEIAAERDALSRDLARLEDEIAEMENLTRRLSDTYLDLDLLDQQARSVLGLLRADEIVIR